MASDIPATRLRDVLVEEGVCSPGQIEDALQAMATHGGKLAEILIERGYLVDTKLEKVLAGQPGIASVDLTRYTIQGRLCELIPEEIAVAHQVFPIDKMGKLLTVGMAVPIDAETIEKLKSVTGLRVKAVYCKPEHIDGAIERYYKPDEFKISLAKLPPEKKASDQRAQGPAAMVRIAGLLKGIDELPSLPDTVEKTKQAVDNPDIEIEVVVDVIGRDPLVSVQLLKLCNSAAYNLPSRIDNVGAAVKLLGLRETYSIVLSSAVISMVESAKSFDFQAFWQQALFAASAVPEIARAAGTRVSSALSTAGLLHDIGRFGLAQVAPDDYAKIGSDLSGNDLVKAEEEAFGLGHPEAAYILASRWDLPENIYVPIRFHHRPDRAADQKKEACIISLAAFLAEAHTSGRKLETDQDFEEVATATEELALNAQQLQDAQQEAALKLTA